MNATIIVFVALVTILVFFFGIFVGAKKASKEFSEKLDSAWIELNWPSRDYIKLIGKLNKMK
jgi:hypothetical protein